MDGQEDDLSYDMTDTSRCKEQSLDHNTNYD